MKKYVDVCMTYKILLQDSGLITKPNENWKTFSPVKKDIAHVVIEKTDYGFNGIEWIRLNKERSESVDDYVFDGEKWEKKPL